MEKGRRDFLKLGLGLVGALGLTSLQRKGVSAHVGEEKGFQAQPVAYPPMIIAHHVLQIPQEPGAAEWGEATPIRMPLGPQMIVKPRLYEPSVTQISVRALYDDDRVGFLLEWHESTETQGAGIGRTDRFRDAVAFSFPADATKPIPYFAMGEPHNEVIVYHWKSDWELVSGYDVENEFKGMHADFYPFSGKNPGQIATGADYGSQEKAEWESNPRDKSFNTAWSAGNILADPEARKRASVEKLVASGFGNLTTDSSQDCTARATWGNGWHVVITAPRKQDRFRFRPGLTYPINFAVWDGHAGERGGEKSITTWNSLVLEKRAGAFSFAAAIVAAAVVGAAEWVILRRRRLNNSKSGEGK